MCTIVRVSHAGFGWSSSEVNSSDICYGGRLAKKRRRSFEPCQTSPLGPPCAAPLGRCSRLSASVASPRDGHPRRRPPAPFAGLGKASVSAFSIGHARKGDGQRAGTTDKYYDSPSAFGSQRASGKSSGAAFSMSGRAAPSPGRGEPSPGPGHYAAVKAGEAYSDTTRFGGQSIAKQSENWARQLGRSSSSSRDIDFAHRY